MRYRNRHLIFKIQRGSLAAATHQTKRRDVQPDKRQRGRLRNWDKINAEQRRIEQFRGRRGTGWPYTKCIERKAATIGRRVDYGKGCSSAVVQRTANHRPI